MIRTLIQTNNTPFFRQLRASIKAIEIEETYDLYVNRPLGLLLAFVAKYLNLTPIEVSLMSLVVGMFGGYFFLFQQSVNDILVGALLILFAGVLDSADGQLARLTKQSSQAGMIIDGTIDAFVHISIYFFGAFAFYPQYGFAILLLSLCSILTHHIQASIYDFYKNEFLYLYGDYKSFRNLDPKEIQAIPFQSNSRFLQWIVDGYQSYVYRQNLWITRKADKRRLFEQAKQMYPHQFKLLYYKTYVPFFRYLALCCGTIVHSYLIIVFSLFHRFDLYLLVNLILLVPSGLISWRLSIVDHRFLKLFHR